MGLAKMTEFKDKNFDVFAERFEKNIYEHPKGKIRIKLLLEDVFEVVPGSKNGQLQILDAGCGTGYFSAILAESAEHKFTLCDISSSMLKLAQERFSKLTDIDATFHHLPIQEVGYVLDCKYDLVLVHAVLEWLSEPRAALERVLPLLKSDGYLSLLFYNQYSLVYRHLIMGNYRRLNDRAVNGFGGTLTPINPLDPYRIEEWLNELGLDIVRKTGIRTFYDYQTAQTKEDRSFEDTYEMERRYARQLPFMYLGRYIHFLCRWS